MKLYIVLPAYNEGANIGSIIQQWYPMVEKVSSNNHLVILDDDSKDQTNNKILEFQPKYPQVSPHTKFNFGHSATCLTFYLFDPNQGADHISSKL
jgi:glycosyltransferase involved in cell wall biosynthesis